MSLKVVFPILSLFGMVLIVWPSSFIAQASIYVSGIKITEIGYSGTYRQEGCDQNKSCSNDKWLELYNQTDKNISLVGYKLLAGKNSKTGEFVSTYNFPEGSEIKAKDFLVISSKSISSTLDEAGIANIKVGALFSISSNTAGKKYIRVGIQSPEGFVETIDIKNLDSVEDQFKIKQTTTEKISLTVDPSNGKMGFSKTQFYPGNFGTPNSFAQITSDTNIESATLQPIFESSEIKVESLSDNLPTNVIPNTLKDLKRKEVSKSKSSHTQPVVTKNILRNPATQSSANSISVTHSSYSSYTQNYLPQKNLFHEKSLFSSRILNSTEVLNRLFTSKNSLTESTRLNVIENIGERSLTSDGYDYIQALFGAIILLKHKQIQRREFLDKKMQIGLT